MNRMFDVITSIAPACLSSTLELYLNPCFGYTGACNKTSTESAHALPVEYQRWKRECRSRSEEAGFPTRCCVARRRVRCHS